MSSSEIQQQEWHQLAEAYALGVLDDNEHKKAEDLMRIEPAFSKLVYIQLEQFQPMVDAISELNPPASVWQGVQQELNIGDSAAKSTLVPSIWQSLNFWRGFGVSASLMAMALAMTLTLNTPSGSSGMVYVVQGNSQTEWIMRAAANKQNTIAIEAVNVRNMADGEYCHLWAKTADGKTYSLSKLPAHGTIDIGLTDGKKMLSHDTELLITIENINKKNSKPSGRVVSRGNWVAI
ncbi:MAG: anti-sigma factor [Sedimenticola sp.]